MRQILSGIGVCLSLLFGGCLVSPPPLAMPLEGSMRQPTGAGSVTVYGAPSVLDDFDGSDAESFTIAGGKLRYQASPQLSIGADFGTAINLLADDNDVELFSQRLSVRFNPTDDKLALRFGLGNWTDSSLDEGLLQFGTIDGGFSTSFYTADDQVEVYFGGTVALGFSLQDDIGTEPTTYGGASIGVIALPEGPFHVGVDASALAGKCFSQDCQDLNSDNTFFYSSLTLNLSYTFGGSSSSYATASR